MNITLASMHPSRTVRLLRVLQFAAHCPRKDHIPLRAVVALETVQQPCESSEKQRVWGDGPRLSPGLALRRFRCSRMFRCSRL